MNSVYIAQSLDGYIADKNHGLEWLQSVPNAENVDMGYNNFIKHIDAILMGRNTYETVCGFDMPWPYTKPVFVLSTTLRNVPKNLKDKVEFINGDLHNIVASLELQGFNNLYIDGGKTINSFLKEDMIDEMTLTTIPILLGGGTPLFRELSQPLMFEEAKSKVFLNAIVQTHFTRKRE